MDEKSTAGLAHDLGTLFRIGASAGLTDGQLLDRFAAGGDGAEAAFEGIVRRHGPMVLGVCRRALGDVHAADDAFQATFLVLAFRAGAITRRESLAPWLHGVAFRLARRIRALARRQPKLSCPLPEAIAPAAIGDAAELRTVLDEELGRLPEKYRRPVVLCYLQGLTQAEAARALGWTKGTVSGRLARAKDLLRGRLTRRGLAPAAGLLAGGAAPGIEAAAMAVPSSLLGSTTRAAMAVGLGVAEAGAVSKSVLALARGGLRSMLVGRLKAAAFLLMLGGLGGTVVSGYAGPEDPPIARGNAVATAARSTDPPLPPGARLRMGTTRLRHEAEVVRAVFSPDGRTLVTAGRDGAVRFWDPRTGMAAPGWDLPREAAPPLAADYSPDGQLLAVGRRDGTVQLWDVAAKRERFRSKVHKGEVQGIAFSPDGLTLASSSGEDKCVRLWDVATGRERGTLEFSDEAKNRGPLAFSPDGRRLALGMESQTEERSVVIRIWDLGDDVEEVVIRGAHDFGLAGLLFTKDSKALISGGYDDQPVVDGLGRKKRNLLPRLTFWDTRDGRRLREMEPADAFGLGGFALARDGTTLVSSHRDQLLVWDIDSGRVTRTIPIRSADVGEGTTGVAIAPDGRTIAMLGHDHTVRLLDFASGQPLSNSSGSHEAAVLSASFTPDGRTLATTGADGKVCLWDAADGTPRGQFKLNERGWSKSVCVSPDGRLLAAAGEDPDSGKFYFGGTARIWDLADGRLLRELKLDHRATLVGFSADSRRVAVATCNMEAVLGMWGKAAGPPDDTVRVFDVATGRRLAELCGHGSRILAFAFAPDGRSLVTASQDMSFRFWDPDSGKPLRQIAITGHVRNSARPSRGSIQIASAAFAPDLKWAVTSGEQDDRLIVWDLTTGEARRTIRVEGKLSSRVAISPDGRRFASVAGSIRLWDMASGRELQSLACRGMPIRSLAFAPDGMSLATGLADTTAIVWDLGAATPRDPAGGKP